VVDRVEHACLGTLRQQLIRVNVRFNMVDEGGPLRNGLLPGRGLGQAEDIVMTGGVGHFYAGNDTEIRNWAKVGIGTEGVVIGDGKEIHPFTACQCR
jgi:hypothetical protein